MSTENTARCPENGQDDDILHAPWCAGDAPGVPTCMSRPRPVPGDNKLTVQTVEMVIEDGPPEYLIEVSRTDLTGGALVLSQREVGALAAALISELAETGSHLPKVG